MKDYTDAEIKEFAKVIPQKRIRPDEKTDLFRYSGGVNLLNQYAKLGSNLENRIRMVPNGWRDLQMIASMSNRLLQRLVFTIPNEQLIPIMKTQKGMVLRVGFAKPSSREQEDKEFGRWVSVYDQYTAIDLAKEHCQMCSLDRNGRRTCRVREMLEGMPISDTIEDEDKDCKFWRVWSMERTVILG